MASDLLIIMARYPTRGRVKTRLARDIGATAATALYKSFLQRYRHEFDGAAFAVEWHFTPARAPFRRVVDPGVVIHPQLPGDLGAKMQQSFARGFAEGRRRIVMIGTDAPEVGCATVRRAFRLLQQHPVVLQPTLDGGYALIGLTELCDVFTDIAWSTAAVMAQTRARLWSLHRRWAELPVTFDVDTAADLARLSNHAPRCH